MMLRSAHAPLRRLAPLGVALLLAPACRSFGPAPSPATLVESAAYVRVRYAAPQRLPATIGERDTLLADVTMIEGVPTRTSGDTLHVRIARWHAGGWFRAVDAPSMEVAVLPSSGAVVERRQLDAGRTTSGVLITIGVIAAVAAIALLVGLQSLGPNY